MKVFSEIRLQFNSNQHVTDSKRIKELLEMSYDAGEYLTSRVARVQWGDDNIPGLSCSHWIVVSLYGRLEKSGTFF